MTDDINARLAAFESPEDADDVRTYTLRPAVHLSPREEQITIALALGGTNRQIAADLGISIKTVDTHRMHALEKTASRNNSDLTRYAIQVGMIGVYPAAEAP